MLQQCHLLQFLLLLFFHNDVSVDGLYIKRHHARDENPLHTGEDLRRNAEMRKRAENARVSFKECNMDPGERGDCGFYGMKEDDCYKRECCWGKSSTEGVPWCYHSKPTITAECAMESSERLECGFYGIRKEQCLATECCWRPSNENDVPWCFHYKRVPAFTGECGLPPISPNVLGGRVGGGHEAKPHSWPWQVSLQRSGGRHYCGGSFINDQWILSAAHCAGFNDDGAGVIEIGAHSLSGNDTFQRILSPEQVIPHESFSWYTLDFDFMVIKLSERVEFSDHIQPVCLPEITQRVEGGTHCYTSGWGSLELMGETPDLLQQVMLPVVSEEMCMEEEYWGNFSAPGYDLTVTDNMMCGGYAEGGRGICHGDSGGPFVCYTDEHWVQYGIASWIGGPCTYEFKPTIYARVSSAIPWIEENIAKYGRN